MRILLAGIALALICAPFQSRAVDFSFSENSVEVSVNRAYITIVNDTESTCLARSGSSASNLNVVSESMQGPNRLPNTWQNFFIYNLMPSTTYYYKVVCTATQGGSFETPVKSFTIPALGSTSSSYIRVLSPNGGERINLGQTIRISWEQRNVRQIIIRAALSDNNMLEIDSANQAPTGGAAPWYKKGGILDTSDGIKTYDWTPSGQAAVPRDYKIYILGYPGTEAPSGSLSSYDQSDASFSIVVPTPPTPSTSNPTAPSTPSASTTSSPKNEAARLIASGSDLNAFLAELKKNRSGKDQEYAMRTYTSPLAKQKRLSLKESYVINNFIVYGTRSTSNLSAQKRVQLIRTYLAQKKALPKTEAQWSELLALPR